MVQKVCPSFCVLFASCRGAGAGLRNPGAIPVGSRYTTEWPTGSECDQIFPTHSYAELNTLPKIFTNPSRLSFKEIQTHNGSRQHVESWDCIPAKG